MKRTYLSVVIPAYKEEENIKAGVLNEIAEYLSKQKYSWEVLLVDDGSPDETPALLNSFASKHKGFRVMQEPHRGKGGTVISGMLAADGEIILFTDMDQATPINQIEKFFPKFESGFDGVIGSRAGREGAPIIRKIMAVGFTILRTLVLRLPYKDTQCGFKAFKKQATREIFKRLKVFKENEKIEGAAVTAGFDLEILYVARKLGMKVVEVPVEWHHKGSARVNPFKDSIQALRDLFKVRINGFTGKYNV